MAPGWAVGYWIGTSGTAELCRACKTDYLPILNRDSDSLPLHQASVDKPTSQGSLILDSLWKDIEGWCNRYVGGCWMNTLATYTLTFCLRTSSEAMGRFLLSL